MILAQGLGDKATEIAKEVLGGSSAPASSVVAPKEAPKPEVVTLKFWEFVRADLAAKLASAPQKEHQFELRGKGSVMRFSVSLVEGKDGYRHVFLKVVGVTGEFTKNFREGFRFYQAEVFGLVDVRDPVRRKSTEALRKVVAGIELGISEEREKRKNEHRDRRPHRGSERREVKAQTAK